MSRRKAGRVPRRVDPEPDDDMEMPDLIIDVKPDRDLGSLAQGPWSARDVPMPGLFGVERRLQTASRPLGSPSTCAPWMPLSSMSSGEFLPSPLLASGPSGGCLSPGDGPGTGLASPAFASDLRVSPLHLGALTLSRAPPHRSPPASSLQTGSPGPTSTQIC